MTKFDGNNYSIYLLRSCAIESDDFRTPQVLQIQATHAMQLEMLFEIKK